MADKKTPAGYQTDLIAADLKKLREQGLYRSPRIISSRNGAEINIENKKLINFSSNDYLGLANHPKIIQAANDAAIRFGTGSSASPLVCGKTSLHEELENKLASATGRDRALLFTCGYTANLGIIQGLTRAIQHQIFMDRLCHASIIDGVVLSRAKFRRYAHAAPDSLMSLLKAAKKQKKLVLTESVFSMDGDIAPLTQISELCQEFAACLIVDDAHGFGVLGKTGMGGLEQLRLSQEQAPLMMATFGKALGLQGAFVAGKEELVETLVQRARPYIYSTSMSVPNVAGVIQALELVNEGSDRRQKLKTLAEHLQSGLRSLGKDAHRYFTPIQPLVIGSPQTTLAASEFLERHGLYVTAIRPPTVPRGSSRLRITLTAGHTREQVSHLLDTLKSFTSGPAS